MNSWSVSLSIETISWFYILHFILIHQNQLIFLISQKNWQKVYYTDTNYTVSNKNGIENDQKIHLIPPCDSGKAVLKWTNLIN